MHKLAVLFCASFAVPALAQCNPGTLVGLNVGGNQGNEGGGAYFDLTVNTTITITAINFRAGNTAAHPAASTNTGHMEVYLGPSTWVGNTVNAAAWTHVCNTAVGTVTHNGTATTPGVLSPGPLVDPVTALPFALTLAPGTYGVALKSELNIFNHNYSNPPNGTVYSTPELTLTAGGAQNAFLTGTVFSPRIWNGEIVYTCGGTPIRVATSQNYGTGCYGWYTSYGETIGNASTSLDIAGQTHTLGFAGPIYAVSGTATNTYTAPGGGAVALGLTTNASIASVATALGGSLPFPILYPRQNAVGIANDLEVCASGFINPVDAAGITAPAPGTQGGTFIAPTLADFFGLHERWCPLWQSMAPVSGTEITAEVLGTAPTRQLVITWAAVLPTGYTGVANTFQVVFDEATNNVVYRYDAATTGNGGGPVPVVMGWTQGNGALDHQIDVSTRVLAGFLTQPVDNTPASVILSARPVLGSNPNYVISGYDAPSTNLGVVALSLFAIPSGISLTAIGAPDCSQYVGTGFGQLDLGTRLFITGGAASVTMSVIPGGIPVNPTFNGLQLFAQAVTITGNCAGSQCNSLGAIASAGLRIMFGSL
ncbi:MAG: hypothetical protein U1E73_00250 [Planctomycetota bacterium]